MGLVLELQQDCLNADRRVSDILRKAKALAVKLGLNELVGWIDQELNGYQCSVKELPNYRKAGGAPKFWNPYRGYCPIMVRPGNFGELITTVFLNQSVSELESLASASSGSELVHTYPPGIQEVLQQQMDIPMECSLHFSTSQVKASLDAVRNKILDWTLELEARGILGDGHSFNLRERKEAASVTNHIYGGNFGVLGSVDGDANSSGFVSLSGNVSNAEIRSFARQVSEAIPALPADKREAITSVVQELEAQSERNDPDRGIIAKSLASLRTVLEGTAGNLAAAGILAAIPSLMGG